LIELEGITVSLPQNRADAAPILDGISLTIGEGEWIALVGSNGAGKTTLIKVLAGLIPPSAGRINGVPRRVGFLFQDPDNQFVASSVRDELLLSLPESVDDTRLRDAAARFSLDHVVDRNPHRLSGGEKQRLAFATVSLSNPELVLLDEPTSYLDEFESRRCVEFVHDLNANGTSVVWVAPRVDEVGSARRVVCLDRGRVASDGRLVADVAAAPERSAPPRGQPAGRVVASFEDVSFDYGQGKVFDGLSIQLGEGECVGITGRNGSGKTTLLGLLSGLLEATAGAVHMRYQRRVEDGRQNVFYLFQSPERLFFAETVREEVAFGLRANGVPHEEIGERVTEALATADLDPHAFLDRMPFTLSFGEMRRVAFAIARALKPRLLLLDEPTSCLDDDGISTFEQMIRQSRDDGCTVVIASHDNSVLARVVDRVIEL
jgi:energy-coupling factor transporter ATP-binding protein EcfA2